MSVITGIALAIAWIAVGGVLALAFGRAASFGRTEEEQRLEDEEQMAYLRAQSQNRG